MDKKTAYLIQFQTLLIFLYLLNGIVLKQFHIETLELEMC